MRGGGRGKPRGQRGHLEPGQVLVQPVSASLRPPSRASVRAVAGKSPKPPSLTMVNRRELLFVLCDVATGFLIILKHEVGHQSQVNPYMY